MKKTRHPFLRDLRDNRVKWLMILPAAVVVILMCYVPMGGIVLAFKEFNYHDGIFGSPWVGFKNFAYFFQSGKAWTTTRNTILYNIAFLCVNTLLSWRENILSGSPSLSCFFPTLSPGWW